MEPCDDIRRRILARPPPEELARRRQVIDEIRRLRISIAPLTALDLRRMARQEREGEDPSNGLDPGVDT